MEERGNTCWVIGFNGMVCYAVVSSADYPPSTGWINRWQVPGTHSPKVIHEICVADQNWRKISKIKPVTVSAKERRKREATEKYGNKVYSDIDNKVYSSLLVNLKQEQ